MVDAAQVIFYLNKWRRKGHDFTISSREDGVLGTFVHLGVLRAPYMSLHENISSSSKETTLKALVAAMKDVDERADVITELYDKSCREEPPETLTGAYLENSRKGGGA